MAKSIAQRLEGCPDSMSTPDFRMFESLKEEEFKKIIIGFRNDSNVIDLEDYLIADGMSMDEIERIDGLRKVCVTLTKKQIYEVAKLDYVNSVMGDQIIFGYHTPKKD